MRPRFNIYKIGSDIFINFKNFRLLILSDIGVAIIAISYLILINFIILLYVKDAAAILIINISNLLIRVCAIVSLYLLIFYNANRLIK